MNKAQKTAFRERARAAFLGLALGDAYGAPLEFIRGESVRKHPVKIEAGSFMWTDDTHMAMYLAKAILDCPVSGLTFDILGRAVAKRFVEWSHDPLTPSTAPGTTCLRGVQRYEKSKHWQTSGVAESDGCGAVMRICPLGMAFAGHALTEAARISAIVTHGHPNAISAAIAASHMLRDVLETGTFDSGTVGRAIKIIDRHDGDKNMVVDALQAALKVAKSDARWLDEEAIPDGGGGWRSASALGLATAAALRWEGSFEQVVDRAARIHGDSDSVACLAGMLAAAAHGTAVLPKNWLKILPQRKEIESLADQLTQRQVIESLSESPMKESVSKPDLLTETIAESDVSLIARLKKMPSVRFVPDRDEARGQTAIKVKKADAASLAFLTQLASSTGRRILEGIAYNTLLVPSTSIPASVTNKTMLAPKASNDQHSSVSGARTSTSDPIYVDWLIKTDDLLGPGKGKIGITIAPGKKGPSDFGSPWNRDLAQDLDRLVEEYQTAVLVCLMEQHELDKWKMAGIFTEAQNRGIIAIHEPVKDLTPPTLAQARRVTDLAIAAARAGKNVVVQCRGGRGRGGTMGACCYVALGAKPTDAIAQVRESREGAVERQSQEEFVREFHNAINGKRGEFHSSTPQ